MKLLRTLIAPLLAVTFVVGCGDDIGPDSTPEEVAEALAGTWNATSFVFTNKANSSETFDLVADGGLFIITFTAAGGFSGRSTFEGETETFGGTYVVQGTNVIITDEDDPNDMETIAFILSGDTLTLTLDDQFDFDDDDVEESATLTIVLQRAPVLLASE